MAFTLLQSQIWLAVTPKPKRLMNLQNALKKPSLSILRLNASNPKRASNLLACSSLRSPQIEPAATNIQKSHKSPFLSRFYIARKHGIHVVMKHVDGRITVIPVHPRENIGVGLLLKIVKDAKLDREEFIKLLAKT